MKLARRALFVVLVVAMLFAVTAQGRYSGPTGRSWGIVSYDDTVNPFDVTEPGQTIYANSGWSGWSEVTYVVTDGVSTIHDGFGWNKGRDAAATITNTLVPSNTFNWTFTGGSTSHSWDFDSRSASHNLFVATDGVLDFHDGWAAGGIDATTAVPNGHDLSTIFKWMIAEGEDQFSRLNLVPHSAANFEDTTARTFIQNSDEWEATYSACENVTARSGIGPLNLHHDSGKGSQHQLRGGVSLSESAPLITLSWYVTGNLVFSGLSTNSVTTATA